MESVVVGVFADEVRERVRRARAQLAAALDAEDAYGAALAEDEVEDALRMAREHGICTDDGVAGA
ncbi:hypothetical protein [Streptomyces sp. NBC_01618]|uniref:hypothetical protein n=1 Tax=Streptomyces sp. NBC_01618 TaxID=2975900 RepID=UPI0038674B7B|nr:hypothetical protein OH735_35090 [Streptomyces sp. NBC_01618]